jgi:hypothetical protein
VKVTPFMMAPISCIDTAFGWNVDNLSCMNYDSYFSYHRPILSTTNHQAPQLTYISTNYFCNACWIIKECKLLDNSMMSLRSLQLFSCSRYSPLYGIHMFTRANHWILSWATWIQSTPCFCKIYFISSHVCFIS